VKRNLNPERSLEAVPYVEYEVMEERDGLKRVQQVAPFPSMIS